MDNWMELTFPSLSVNEGFARAATAAFASLLNWAWSFVRSARTLPRSSSTLFLAWIFVDSGVTSFSTDVARLSAIAISTSWKSRCLPSRKKSPNCTPHDCDNATFSGDITDISLSSPSTGRRPSASLRCCLSWRTPHCSSS